VTESVVGCVSIEFQLHIRLESLLPPLLPIVSGQCIEALMGMLYYDAASAAADLLVYPLLHALRIERERRLQTGNTQMQIAVKQPAAAPIVFSFLPSSCGAFPCRNGPEFSNERRINLVECKRTNNAQFKFKLFTQKMPREAAPVTMTAHCGAAAALRRQLH
jgi:hypothetical protein